MLARFIEQRGEVFQRIRRLDLFQLLLEGGNIGCDRSVLTIQDSALVVKLLAFAFQAFNCLPLRDRALKLFKLRLIPLGMQLAQL